MVTASLIPTKIRKTTANAAQRAPPTAPAMHSTTSADWPGSPVPMMWEAATAPTPPMMSCPSPPTLTRPALAGTVTARAAKISGIDLTRTDSNERSLPSDVHMLR